MRRAVARAVLLGVLLSGVARADSGWREIQAPHVVLRTDLGSGRAREAALAAERFRAEIIAAAWPRATLPASDRRRELAVALELEPANASALLLQARRAPAAERAALARRITEAHPDDWRGWVALGQALASNSAAATEREAAFRKALALQPDDPTPLNDLARLYARQGKAAEGAPLIGKAIQLAPYDPSILDTLAAVQAQLGRCSEAVASQARAIDALPDGAPPAVRRDLEARLEQYRTRCAPVGTTPGSGG